MKKEFCAYCENKSRLMVDEGVLNQRFMSTGLKGGETSLRCVCNKRTILSRFLKGKPYQAIAIVGSMWCISIFSQAQDGLVVQSEKVYLGKNQQPAPILKVVPADQPEELQLTSWTKDEAEPEKPLKIVKIPPAASKKEPVATVKEPVKQVDLAESKQKDDKPPRFEILEKDETLSLALRRWSVLAGYQLVWDTPKDFPARQTDYGADGFELAIEEVMRDTSRSSYPLHACLYKNKVLRVLHVSQSCER